MEESENIYDKIREFFGTTPGNLNILEEQIDLDTQMKYFDCSRKFKKGLVPAETLDSAGILFLDCTGHDRKREMLAKLASVSDVKAFRHIERFLESCPDELRDWTVLAYQESKMLLESKLLDENQIFISTGLGGKGDKLRYFVVIIGNQLIEFSELQKKIIRQEFDFILKKYDSEVEDFNFSGDLATIMAIVPMRRPVKAVFEEAIAECNNFGNFINTDFVITNVKTLSFDEINDFLNERNRQKS